MQLLIDMNLTPRWVKLLTSAGLVAKHWSDVGDGRASDAEIMDDATTHVFVVFTHDLDFGAILAATGSRKPSVVQLRAEDPSPEAVGAQVVKALKHVMEEIDTGALVTIEPSRSRIRLLPFPSGD